MRYGFGAAVSSLLVSGVLLLPSWTAAQVEVFGLKASGEAEVGGRIFVDHPSKANRAKFEEYRDIPSGVFPYGVRDWGSMPSSSNGINYPIHTAARHGVPMSKPVPGCSPCQTPSRPGCRGPPLQLGLGSCRVFWPQPPTSTCKPAGIRLVS
jgi:hypothetical protein